MPLYSFELRDGSFGAADKEGINLPDRKLAHDYALKVVSELMTGGERQTRSWCLDVYEDDGERIFTIPFVQVDHTLNHLPPALRATVEAACEVRRQIGEVMQGARTTMREAQALIARSRGKPYLASFAGQATIRSELGELHDGAS